MFPCLTLPKALVLHLIVTCPLLALSWEFPKLTISLFIMFLSIGCQLIHEYNKNSLLCATTARTLPFMSIWLNSWTFTHLSARYALRLIRPLFVFSLCARTRLVRDLFVCYTVCLEQSPLQRYIIKHSHLSNHLSNLTSSSYPIDPVWFSV